MLLDTNSMGFRVIMVFFLFLNVFYFGDIYIIKNRNSLLTTTAIYRICSTISAKEHCSLSQYGLKITFIIPYRETLFPLNPVELKW